MDAKETEFAIKQRVQQVFAECKITVNRFAILSGLNQKTINDQINGTAKIGAVTLSALLAYRPDLSAEWLLRGTGDMLNKQADTIIIHNDASGDSVRTGNITGDHNIVGSHNGAAPATGTNTMQDDYKRLLAEKDKQIINLQKDKDNLMQLLTNLTAKR